MAYRRCHYCTKRAGTTTDHIVPRDLGGPNAKWNYIEACKPCNEDKGHDWPSCPCGICETARAMYLWSCERGLLIDDGVSVMTKTERDTARSEVVKAATKAFAERLWAERVVRAERWEDAAWIGQVLSSWDEATGKVSRQILAPDAEPAPRVANTSSPHPLAAAVAAKRRGPSWTAAERAARKKRPRKAAAAGPHPTAVARNADGLSNEWVRSIVDGPPWASEAERADR